MLKLATAGPLSFLFLNVLQIVTAVEVNRTIDDTNGDSVTGAKPIYLPRVGRP